MFVFSIEAFAHGGRTNSQGCHNNRKTGDYHCHGRTGSKSVAPKSPGTYYANCTRARAAGVTPLRVGDKGYGRHLDRDRDGIACE